MADAKLYFGGIPTEPDVRKLFERFGTPQPGLLAHETIESVIREKHTAGRYRTIVGSWRRKLLREYNVATKAEPGEGIRVLTEPERVDEGRALLGKSARQIVRAHRWSVMIDATKLDDISRRKLDHTVRASATAAAAVTGSIRELSSALKAAPQLPRKTAS